MHGSSYLKSDFHKVNNPDHPGQMLPKMYLDTLSHTLRYLDVVLAAHVLLDVGCEVVTSGTDGVVAHDTTE